MPYLNAYVPLPHAFVQPIVFPRSSTVRLESNSGFCLKVSSLCLSLQELWLTLDHTEHIQDWCLVIAGESCLSFQGLHSGRVGTHSPRMTTPYRQVGSNIIRRTSGRVERLVLVLHSVCSLGHRDHVMCKSGYVNVFASVTILMQLPARCRALPQQCLSGCLKPAFRANLPVIPPCWALLCTAEWSQCAN